jgi:DNA-directed RNA polymerase subunit RPC12/RpoP
VTPAWFLTSLLLPPAAALGAWLVLRGRTVPPHLVIVLNALVPGAGLAAAGSPQLEVAGGVLFAIVSLLTVGRVEDIGYWLPIMGIGGAWGLLHTPFNPLARQLTGERPRGEELADRPPAPAAVAVAHPTVARPTADRPGEADAQEETGYAVSIRCTECGADLDVPVLQRMARCPYCASDHLIVGHDEELLLAVPERIQSEAELREAILDHYRYQYYLKLYQRHVAPLERRAVEATPQGALTTRPEVDAAAAAAERAVAQRADAHRRKLEDKLWTGSRLHFMAPYRHGMGTLYQAAFGRTLQGLDKELHFAVAVLEASTLASAAVDLPPMGKLSYLKALLPAAQLGEGARTLPLEHGEEALGRAFG